MLRAPVLVVACLAGLAVPLAAVRSDACTCATSPTSCRTVATADAVFEATVASLETAPAGVTYGSARLRRITLTDVKALRGAHDTTVVTPWGADSCGYAFRPGVRYFVVAHRGADGRLAVYQCGETVPLEYARAQLEYLGTLNGPPTETRVWGSVYRSSSQQWTPFAPAPVGGATVTVKGPVERTVTSDATGQFLITGLPRGTYSVEAIATIGDTPRRSRVEGFDWKPDEPFACAAVGLGIPANGRISGTLLNEFGEPIAGAEVFLHAVDPATSQPGTELVGTSSDEQGRYVLGELPPGRYLATANWLTGPTFVAPHPPAVAQTTMGSEVIALGLDEAQTLAPLQLERLAAITVTGTVRDQRGAPVAGVQIRGRGIHHNGARYPIATRTIAGANGQFELLLWRGQRYVIEAYRGDARLASLELVAAAEPLTITVPR
jgi:hypothetical protein